MKKDSNMFNDNSIETEGVPADKTAEIRRSWIRRRRRTLRSRSCSSGASSPASRSARLVQESSVRRFSSAAVDMPSHMPDWTGKSECPCGVPVKGR